jgi:hypothetical protein
MRQNLNAEDVNLKLIYLSLRGVRLRPSGQGLEFFIKFLDKPRSEGVDFSWFADQRSRAIGGDFRAKCRKLHQYIGRE